MMLEAAHLRCVRGLLAAGTLVLLAVACGAPKPRQAPAPAPTAPVGAPAGAGYRIDPAHSELRVLVYRAGIMSALGHNHVIVNRALEGWVRFTGSASGAAFALTVPVSGFVVDEAEARRQEGAEFAEQTPEAAKAGTLENMLSPAVLDAAAYPLITVRSLSVMPSATGMQARVRVSVAGHQATLAAPFTLQICAGRLSASGMLAVRQSDLGMTPFSVMMGALRVQDELRVKFRLLALAR
ncbi:MAG TPA: YceI family protein [Steroidobacteraceae bacterium]|nr:YceI family protein [Steroidobacteraceae bacterium]